MGRGDASSTIGGAVVVGTGGSGGALLASPILSGANKIVDKPHPLSTSMAFSGLVSPKLVNTKSFSFASGTPSTPSPGTQSATNLRTPQTAIDPLKSSAFATPAESPQGQSTLDTKSTGVMFATSGTGKSASLLGSMLDSAAIPAPSIFNLPTGNSKEPPKPTFTGPGQKTADLNTISPATKDGLKGFSFSSKDATKPLQDATKASKDASVIDETNKTISASEKKESASSSAIVKNEALSTLLKSNDSPKDLLHILNPSTPLSGTRFYRLLNINNNTL